MADLSGRTLGKYQLQERLGRGGMAEVYKAFHPGLDRFVAVKVLHPHLADAPDFLGRFRREAQAVAQLHHPHIVQVFDFDVEGELHYMVMEYVQGLSLKTRLDELYARGERLPLSEILALFRALLDAVGYAHARGMVHRDLKPANVMLDEGRTTKDESNSSFVLRHSSARPVLTDFGIARILGGAKITSTGVSVGTPAYMSPEQGQGEPGDSRSDIYALGVMLFECLAGQVPYEGDTTLGVLLKHISAPIPSIRELQPDIPVAIERVVTKALAKDPADRFQTAPEMWQALEAASKGVLIEEPPRAPVPERDTAPDRGATAPVRPVTRTAALGGIAVLVLALIASVVFLSRAATLSPSARALATAQSHAQAGEYQLAVDDFTHALTLDSKNIAARLGRAAAYEQLGQVPDALADIEQVIVLAPGDPRGYEERARLNLQFDAGADPEAALADLNHAVELAPASARAYFLRGWAILNFPLIEGARNPPAALPDLQQSVELDSQNPEAQFTLAQALLAAGQPFDALTAANRAVELDPGSALNFTLRAHIEFGLNDLHAALADLTSAIGVETAPSAQATLYVKRGFVNFKLKDAVTAQANLAEALRLDPASTLAPFLQALLDSTSPRPTSGEAAQAAALAPEDPIWQAIVAEAAP